MMRTWSLEETIIRAQSAAAVAVQGVIDVFTHRPAYANDHPIPGCPSASDCRGFGCAGDCSEALDADERLLDKEAEEEVAEPAECPTGFYAGEDEWYCTGCNGFFSSQAEFAKHRYEDAVPNPTEPSLSDDELVGVRGLLQERYGRESIGCVCPSGLIGASVSCPVHAAPSFGIETGQDLGSLWAAETFPQYTKSNLAAGARAAGSSPSEVSGQPPRPPSEGCPDPSRGNRLASVRGEGSPADSGIRTSPGAPHLTWEGWSIPAITECLADHYIERPTGLCRCGFGDTADLGDWREHVAELIASRLACDPARAIAALHNHKPQK